LISTGVAISFLLLNSVTLIAGAEIEQPEEVAGTESAENEKSSVQEKEKTVAKPAFHNLRYEEDWSVLNELDKREGYDAFKFVPLNDDGSVFLSLGGQLRLRSESWQDFGFGGAGNRDDWFGLSRVRLHGDLHLGPRVRMFVEGKSALSTERDLPGGRRTLDVDTIDLQNALIDVKASLDPVGVTLRVGRQELQFGKQRLVSPLDWANTRRTFDGIRTVVQYDGWRLDGFWSELVAVRKYSRNCRKASHTDFYGIYASGKVNQSGLTADLYWMGLEKEFSVYGDLAGPESRHTVGARIGGAVPDSGADFDLETAYQFGDLGSYDISAFMFAGQAGYSFKSATATPRIYTGFDYASGDDDPGDSSVETFNQLFPLGHAYLGFIDIVGRQNIVDWSIGIALLPHPGWRLGLDFHNFWRANSADGLYNAGGGLVRSGAAGESKRIGNEVDLTLRYAVNKYWNLSGGYSHFCPGSFITESGTQESTDFVHFAVQTTF
jgi:hypothetical protein